MDKKRSIKRPVYSQLTKLTKVDGTVVRAKKEVTSSNSCNYGDLTTPISCHKQKGNLKKEFEIFSYSKGILREFGLMQFGLMQKAPIKKLIDKESF